MSEWPDPVREPDEPPRWVGWVVWAALIGALLWTLRDENGARSFALSDFSLPTIEMPEFTMPAFELPDFPQDQQASDTAVQEAIENASSAPLELDFSAPLVEGVAFEDCVETVNSAASALGAPGVLEDGPDRRVVRFKTRDGDVTFTCDRATQTMRVEQRGG